MEAKTMNTTKQILILTLLTLLFTLGLTGCDVPGEGMYCEPMTTTGRCIDGSWPEACDHSIRGAGGIKFVV